MPTCGTHTNSGSTQPFSVRPFGLDDSRLLSGIDSVQKFSSYASSQQQSRRESQTMAPCFGITTHSQMLEAC